MSTAAEALWAVIDFQVQGSSTSIKMPDLLIMTVTNPQMNGSLYIEISKTEKLSSKISKPIKTRSPNRRIIRIRTNL